MDVVRPTQVAIAVVEHDGRFLIGRRGAGLALEGYWEFPGGKIDPGETPEEAAARECLEETGVAIKVVAQYPGVVWQYPHGLVSLHFFACRPLEPGAAPRAAYRWVARAELAEHRFPEANAMLLERLLRGS